MDQNLKPAVPPRLAWFNKKSRCAATGCEKASLTCAEYGKKPGGFDAYTPRPGNGGGSGAGYSKTLSPCNSEGHS
ncbi:MAG: hypothetical protein JW757_11065, partial [Anaerolineales bacterium]|nr:hypothetical protein [Anaerolineales bacterium]